MIVFSVSSKSWKASGLRTGLAPEDGISRLLKGIFGLPQSGQFRTTAEDLDSAHSQRQKYSIRNPFRLDYQGSDNQKSRWDIDAIDILL